MAHEPLSKANEYSPIALFNDPVFIKVLISQNGF